MQIRVKFRQPFATSLMVLLFAATVILLPFAVMLFLESMDITVTKG